MDTKYFNKAKQNFSKQPPIIQHFRWLVIFFATSFYSLLLLFILFAGLEEAYDSVEDFFKYNSWIFWPSLIAFSLLTAIIVILLLWKGYLNLRHTLIFVSLGLCYLLLGLIIFLIFEGNLLHTNAQMEAIMLIVIDLCSVILAFLTTFAIQFFGRRNKKWFFYFFLTTLFFAW